MSAGTQQGDSLWETRVWERAQAPAPSRETDASESGKVETGFIAEKRKENAAATNGRHDEHENLSKHRHRHEKGQGETRFPEPAQVQAPLVSRETGEDITPATRPSIAAMRGVRARPTQHHRYEGR